MLETQAHSVIIVGYRHNIEVWRYWVVIFDDDCLMIYVVKGKAKMEHHELWD